MRKLSGLASLFVILALALSACGADTSANDNANGGLNANVNENLNGNLNGGLNGNTNGNLNTNVNANGSPAASTPAADPTNANPNLNDNGNANTNANENGALATPDRMETPVATQSVSDQGQLPMTGSNSSPSLASNLQGYPVYNQTGQQVGDVNTVILDLTSERVAYVVIGLDGFLGLGERNVAVPFQAFEVCPAGMGDVPSGNANDSPAVVTPPAAGGSANMNENANDYPNGDSAGVPTGASCAGIDGAGLALRVAADALKNAPEADLSAFDGGNGMSDEGWGSAYDSFWAGYPIIPSRALTSTMTTPVPGMYVPTPGAPATEAVTGTLATPSAPTAPATEIMTGTQATQAVTSTSSTPAAGADGAVAVGVGLRGLIRASDFIGADVYEGDGMALGTVQDVLIDYNTGRILFAVIDPSDMPGSRLIPIPVRAFSWDPTNQRFILVVDAQTLNTAPAFQNSQYPDFTLPAWDNEYRLYWAPFLPTVQS